MNLRALNSATKYPQINTYHHMEQGILQEGRAMVYPPGAKVILTEKVDGTNCRIIRLPGNDYFIGSRELLLYAKGDRAINPFEGVVEHLLPLADRLPPVETDMIEVLYLETYGGRIGAQHKQYTGAGNVGHRLFDIAFIPADCLDMQPEELANWRDHGGQTFATEGTLNRIADLFKIPLTPRLGVVDASDLPADLVTMENWLRVALPVTWVALDDRGGAKAEGLVLRTHDRSVITKARFADYAKTLNPQQRKRKK